MEPQNQDRIRTVSGQTKSTVEVGDPMGTPPKTLSGHSYNLIGKYSAF